MAETIDGILRQRKDGPGQTSAEGAQTPWPVGDGEMAQLIRAHDWASTSLGPIGSWPAHLRSAVDTMLGCGFPATLQWGRELMLLYNDAYVRLMGPRHPGALGKPILKAFPEIEKTYGPLAERVWNGETVTLEDQLFRYVRDTTAEDAWFCLSYSPVHNPEGQVAAILAIGVETTPRVIAERARSESEALLKRAFSAETVGVVFFRLDGTIFDMNRAFERMSGYTRDELLHSVRLDSLAPPEFKGLTQAAAQNLADLGETPAYEKQLVRKDGSRLWGLFAPTRISGTGKSSECVEFIIDISDRRAATERLRETEKLAVVGRLASSIAHEINNPLEAVINLIFLAEKAALSQPTRHYLELAQAELARVSHIVTETLRFNRRTTHPSITNVSEIIDSVITLHEGRLRAAHIDLERHYRPLDPMLLFANELRQVIANLVGNAIDAMQDCPRRKLHICIRKACHPRTNEPGVRISIADTGSGMQPATRGRLFEPFFTTKEATGTGLGLWVTQEIVRKHGGTIHLRSRRAPGPSGTIFSVFLPQDHEPWQQKA